MKAQKTKQRGKQKDGEERSGRQRLSREARRAQLLAIGVRAAEASSFDTINLDQVAREAGISRTLLFHYFPTRQAFLVALAEFAAEELIEATAPDRTLPVEAQLRDSLERFVRYVSERREAYLSLVRGATSGESRMQAVFDRTRSRMAERMLDDPGLETFAPTDGRPPEFLRLVGRGYIGFVEETTCAWLREPTVDATQLVDLLTDAGIGLFEGALGAAE
ncbi:MAG: TetR/AcrR family transcriptional regulator [Myxococcota bacterium]